MPPPPEADLPLLCDLDALDQERAADMLDNRPLYGPGDAVPRLPPLPAATGPLPSPPRGL